MVKRRHPLGIDVGGSGIKGAPVDLDAGAFAEERLRIATPEQSTPDAVADVILRIAEHFKQDTGDSPIGITVPAVVTRGIVRTAANIDKTWIGTDADSYLESRLGRKVTVVNDADAAGVGELHYGAARNVGGLVLLATLGTGIGTALLYDGVLVPNSELGHLEIGGKDSEKQAANSVREKKGLSWKEWAKLLTRYYQTLERLISPDLFVVGGGVSKHGDKFLPLIDVSTPIVPAELRNTAGIVGAAVLASESAG